MTYWSILRRQHVFRVLFGSWVGRLAMAMAAVAIPLALRDAKADYLFIGLVSGSFAIAGAVGSPIIGRIVDRVGQVRVLVPTGVLAAAGFITIALTPGNHALVLTGAILAGALTPPLEPCLRVLWPGMVADNELEKAYAVDSAAQELVFVFGPLVVTLCLAVFTPVSALWAQALLTLVGVATFATAQPARRWTPEKVDHRHWLGPLRHRGLTLLLLAPVGTGVAIGTLNVLVVSYAERFHVVGGAPILLTLNSFASLVGVLVYGMIPWRIQPRTRIVLFAVGLVVGYGMLATVPSPLLMAGLMLLTGFFLAPMLATLFGLISDLAPRGTVTEAFAWLVTLFAAGSSLGAGLVGPVLDTGNLNLAAAHAGAGALFCLLVVSAGYQLFVPAPESAVTA
ncbi:MFS transporter [Amycolatopsis panacis]|uniref:MFS transporter n=1 Tax=Amycolatopsis panacis TaxID=2340917 RepID=A0A419HVB7_9PSEU|nr:MFS transporter [Amycolatopsis panacis]RJQ80812.1 MFS transporter [Amycolatopsis panacis]